MVIYRLSVPNLISKVESMNSMNFTLFNIKNPDYNIKSLSMNKLSF